MKRLNPSTGRPFHYGDRRQDGYVFIRYITERQLKKDGTYVEQWLSEENHFKFKSKRREYEPTITENQRKKRQRRRDWLNDYKVKQGCAKCGYNAHPAALDFDHVNRDEKSFLIGECLNRNWDSILAEVAKCQVLCANCHRIKSVEGKEHLECTHS